MKWLVSYRVVGMTGSGTEILEFPDPEMYHSYFLNGMQLPKRSAIVNALYALVSRDVVVVGKGIEITSLQPIPDGWYDS